MNKTKVLKSVIFTHQPFPGTWEIGELLSDSEKTFNISYPMLNLKTEKSLMVLSVMVGCN